MALLHRVGLRFLRGLRETKRLHFHFILSGGSSLRTERSRSAVEWVLGNNSKRSSAGEGPNPALYSAKIPTH